MKISLSIQNFPTISRQVPMGVNERYTINASRLGRIGYIICSKINYIYTVKTRKIKHEKYPKPTIEIIWILPLDD